MSTSSRWRVRVAADFSVPTVVMTVVGLMTVVQTVVGTPQAGPFGNRGNPEETTFMSCSDSRVDWTRLFLGGSAVHHLYFHPMSIPVTWPGVRGLIRGWVGACMVCGSGLMDLSEKRRGGWSPVSVKPFGLSLPCQLLCTSCSTRDKSRWHQDARHLVSAISGSDTIAISRDVNCNEQFPLGALYNMPRWEISRSYREGISKRWCFDAKVGDYPEL